MKKLTAIICAMVILSVCVCPALAAFDDMVDESHWGYTALNYAIDNSIIKGFEDNTVRPAENLTRAQMAAIVIRLLKTEAVADMSEFVDVDKDAWYYSPLESAVGLGLFLGNGDGHLYPNNPITRQESFVVMSRLLGLREESGDTLFTDNEDIADWARGFIKAMYNAGYISGDDQKNINPKNLITRIEYAQLAYNIYVANISDISADGSSGKTVESVFREIRTSNSNIGSNTGGNTGSNNNDGSSTGDLPPQSDYVIIIDEADSSGDIYIDDIFDE